MKAPALKKSTRKSFDYKLDVDEKKLVKEAHEWSVIRGSRYGRVAWQFIQDFAGRKGKIVF